MTKLTLEERKKLLNDPNYKPRPTQQQVDERTAQRRQERQALLKMLPVSVRRAIDKYAWDKAVEDIGVEGVKDVLASWDKASYERWRQDGVYDTLKRDQDLKAYGAFVRSATKEQVKAMNLFEKETVKKYTTIV